MTASPAADADAEPEELDEILRGGPVSAVIRSPHGDAHRQDRAPRISVDQPRQRNAEPDVEEREGEAEQQADSLSVSPMSCLIGWTSSERMPRSSCAESRTSASTPIAYQAVRAGGQGSAAAGAVPAGVLTRRSGRLSVRVRIR
ncbi:MAG: hypothetical protein WDN24_06260 [Sphingomonas sp.]